MAKLYKGGNALSKKKNIYTLFRILCLAIIAAVWLLIIYDYFRNGRINFIYICITFFVSVIFDLINISLKKQIKIIRAGLSGEKSASELKGYLPKDWVVITNAKIKYDGRESETDMIVVGQNGVFIVEVKNHNQTIVGNAEAQNWTQQKIGRGNGRYSQQFYNPIKQVTTHVYRLANMLRQNMVNVWVQGIVYFSNPTANVMIEDVSDKVPVFSSRHGGLTALAQYMRTYPAEKMLSESQIKHIKNLIS